MDLRVGPAGTASREQTENRRRVLGVPLTEPRKIVIVANAAHCVHKAVAAPLDQSPAVADGDRSRQGAEKALNGVLRFAFCRLEMKLPGGKENRRRRAEAGQQCKRNLPLSGCGKSDRASRAKPERHTIPMWMPVCEGH